MDGSRDSEFFGQDPYDGYVVPTRQVWRRHDHSGPAVQGTSAADTYSTYTLRAQPVPFHDLPESGFYVPYGTFNVGCGEAQFVLDHYPARFGKTEGDGAFGTPDIDTGQQSVFHCIKGFVLKITIKFLY